MTAKLYLCALAGALGLAACQQRATRGFLPAHSEPIARTVPAISLPTEPTAAQSTAPFAEEESDFTVALPTPKGVSPVLMASTTDRLVEAARGTRQESRALRLKAALEKVRANGELTTAPRKLNGAEKAVTKLVMKKLSKKVAKAERGQATQRIDSNISLGIIFLAVALILALLSIGSVYVVIAGVLGAAFLLIGLLNQAAG